MPAKNPDLHGNVPEASAVVLLLMSMNKHLKRARRNAEAGNVYDPSDPPRKPGRPEIPTSP